MASLEELLEGDGFRRESKKGKEVKKSKSLNYNVCRDMNPMRQIRSVPPSGELVKGRESFKGSRRAHRSSRTSETTESSNTRTRYNSESETKSIKPTTLETESMKLTTLETESMKPITLELNKETSLDEAAVKAVISMIGGFCKRFIRDKDLRESLHKKCSSSLQEHKKPQPLKYHAEQAVVANLDWGMDGIESAIAMAAAGINSDGLSESLRNSTRMLSVAASLDVDGLRYSSTCGLKNSCLAACAYFYLAIAYKLQKNDRLAAIHVLQVLCVSPSEGRLNFCNEVWDNLFLPHLLHLKVWYNEQYDLIDAAFKDNLSHNPERSRKLKKLRKLYNKQVDEGTRQFALYYKEWLMIGVKARGTPDIKPPSKLPKKIDNGLDLVVFSEKNVASLPKVPLRRSLSEDIFDTPNRSRKIDSRHESVLDTPNRSRKLDSGHESVLDTPNRSRKLDSRSETVFDTPNRSSKFDSRPGSVFDTPRRSGKLDKTTMGMHNAETNKTITSMPQAQETNVVLEAEELKIRPNGHQVENGVCYIKEGSLGKTGNQVKEADESISKNSIFLEGKELKEEEMLKLWDHMTQYTTFDEKCSIICKLSDRKGNALTLKQFAEIIHSLQQSNPNSYSPLSPLSSSEMTQPPSDSEIETEISQSANLGEECKKENNTVSIRNNSVSDSAGLKPQNTVYFKQAGNIRIPKDFVCPLTDQLFEDPVTIETGQTYERAAIQERLDNGDMICPITRQKLESLTLPNTNSSLKQAVDAWKISHSGIWTEHGRAGQQLEHTVSLQYMPENHADLNSLREQSPKQFSHKLNANSNMESSSQKGLLSRRFSQNDKESFDSTHPISHDLLSNLKQATAILCTSNDLIECEEAALTIAHIWLESNSNPLVEASLSKVAVIDELMEVLSTSENEEVLQHIVCILAELAVKSDLNRKTILRADSDFEIIMRIVKSNIFPHAIVLLHLLKPPPSKLVLLDLISLLLAVIDNTSDFQSLRFSLCTPQEAAILLLEQLLTVLDHTKNRENAKQIISLGGIPFLLRRLELGSIQGKISTVSILCCCMQADGNSRHILVRDVKKASLVELLHCNQGMSRAVVIAFLSELLCLNRRTLISKFLSELQKEGLLNTMHVLLVYLQTASLEQQPMAATLLLQLELLVQPRRYSVYREEALEAIIAALHCGTDKKAQLQAAKALLILGGRFSYLGQTLLEAWLLKKAGLENDFIDSLIEEDDPLEDDMKRWNEEKMATDEWEMKITSALLTKGKPLFEALAKSLSGRVPELAKPCLVTAAWVNCALASMPDTGMQLVACSILLPQLVGCLRHDRQVEERILATLSLHSYMQNPECLQLISTFAQEIIGPLRRLKWVTWTAKELLDVIANDPILKSHADIFVHGEVAQMDASVNGRTEALTYGKRKLYSGHSDGTIKVWDVRNQQPKLITDVRKHKDSVTCLAISQSSERLFSASADKSIMVWRLGFEDLVCMQVVQTKEVVQRISVNALMTFIISEGYGIKVLDNSGLEKILHGNKHVQGVAVAENKVYCGCSDWSIQEVDLRTGEVMSLQPDQGILQGRRSTSCELQVFKDCLYISGNSVEGVSTEVWNLKNKNLAAKISTITDVIAMAVNEDFIYLGCNASTGLIEVWLREKLQKVSVICTESRLSALTFGEDVLYGASEDGKIRAWAPI
ncbi:hypothetical protein SUGI_0814240 [Cryptomeria japonica]|uniref:putative E3 ubiquitin-protein ligase LIN-1 n=1 Tax=Cryptomeria japonica TaxID=3369 RepID=UPI0024149B4E|nr:putative E3 ubiquitin-protein ligase LIN-1 [Cryptomeria japonica]GLJ39830.1 hypothetical protein SUGI_0814240 [Cryptomeria japonica]